jgi:hypothetical protein
MLVFLFFLMTAVDEFAGVCEMFLFPEQWNHRGYYGEKESCSISLIVPMSSPVFSFAHTSLNSPETNALMLTSKCYTVVENTCPGPMLNHPTDRKWGITAKS